MNSYSLEAAWPEPTDRNRAEAIDFWLRESALSEGQAVERAAQLLVLARECDGSVVAVTTVVPSHIAQLGLRCFYFRAFVGRSHRAQGLLGSQLIHQLIRRSYDVLNQRYLQGFDPDVLGLYLEIENQKLQRRRNELVWTDLGANIVFIGTLPGGRHARVWYFDEAKLPRCP